MKDVFIIQYNVENCNIYKKKCLFFLRKKYMFSGQLQVFYYLDTIFCGLHLKLKKNMVIIEKVFMF